MDDYSDLLGDDAPAAPKKRMGRPPRPRTELEISAQKKKAAKAALRAAAQQANVLSIDNDDVPEGALPDVGRFIRPVRITFLANIFQTDIRYMNKRLARCPIIGEEMHQGRLVPVYDFKTACSYIIDSKMDVGTYIRTLNPAHLPVAINKAYWEAENSKLRWMERARHYWHDEDVLDVLGRMAMTIKETTQLWIENLPGKANMSTEQYEAMQANVTDLLDEIHRQLVEMPSQRKTEAVVRSADDLLAGPAEENEDA